jgi:deoxycytidylate deaminase
VRGPCAKRQVECTIRRKGVEYIGRNDCANPQPVCPRLPGEGYEKCQSICQQAGHAEIEALKVAGENADGATACVVGHYWICEPCGRALRDAGVAAVMILEHAMPE